MKIYFKPKNQEDYEFIFNNMNSYFPDPYKSVAQLITGSRVDVLGVVLLCYVDDENKLVFCWALKREAYQEVHTVEEFYEELKQLKLISIL
mgnify:FL=1